MTMFKSTPSTTTGDRSGEYTQLDELLQQVCDELQIPKSVHDEAAASYIAVGSWLGAESSPLTAYRPAIYSQGSFRIGTTVHPIGSDEFDVDAVLELAFDGEVSPHDIIQLVAERLKAHDTYRPMVEILKRCVRLNYARRFHMDILPARHDITRGGTNVLVPDRELRTWLPSNPKGYAAWFELRAEPAGTRKASLEPTPPYLTANQKRTLQLLVQLLKRWRSLAFQDDPESEPRSIVLTTLIGAIYSGEESLSAAFTQAVQRIQHEVGISKGPLIVCNPVNSGEILSEKWLEDPDSYTLFRTRLNGLATTWARVCAGGDIVTTAKTLQALFGEEVVTAQKRIAERLQATRTSQGLSINRSTGILSTLGGVATVPVRRNTFYGE